MDDASTRDAPDLGRYRDARVLVTGASGFIGRHLCRALEAAGARVTRVSRVARAPVPSQAWLALDPHAPGADWSAALDAHAPEVIFHLAGYASGDPSPAALATAVRANVLALVDLAVALTARARPARLVAIGTLESSDPGRGATRVSTPYSASKAMAEIALAALRAGGALDALSLRLGMTYGPDEPNRRRLVPALIDALLAGTPIDVAAGARREDWIYIDDAIDALLRAGVARGPLPASLDVATGKPLPVRQVMQEIAAQLGRGELLRYGARAERAGDAVDADVAASAAALGWSARTTLADGIRRTIDWHRAQAAR